jgi:2-polyprenyl-6-methoxyphenol hydroxylase-like FAD-dependent oxidoreductase
MGRLLGQRAIVVGAGIGGLATAGALAKYFAEVDVLDRDPLTPSVGSRSGTPQDRHSHGLLAGGLQALSEVYPGFDKDLAKAGAVPVKVAQEMRYERADVGVLPQRDFDRSLLCASRPLIERVLRDRAKDLPNVVLRPAHRVTEILPTTDNELVASIRVDAGKAHSEVLHADLVVDASGRGALTMAALDALGWDRPAISEVGVDISYATAVVQIPVDASPDWKLIAAFPDPPELARHGVLIPIEGNRWMVTIADHGADTRIETWEAFLEATRGLKLPTIYNALSSLQPPEDIRHYAFPASVWRHFERLPCLPRGLLPIADAFCRFNPIYGQGMSSAAKQARLLTEVLEQSATGGTPLTAVQAGFMAGVTSVLQTPWNMSTSADFVFPSTRGERPENFDEARQFESALFRAVVVDPVVHRALIDVALLLQPDSLFQEAEIQRRIEAVSARGSVQKVGD